MSSFFFRAAGGKPNPDRTWIECFAQLVGTVLSLWDAAELDAAGEDGEVLPKFINLTDASIKMVESPCFCRMSRMSRMAALRHSRACLVDCCMCVCVCVCVFG